MTYRPHGKHVSIDETSPQALGICDYSGFVFKRIDLVRQMEWRGNALVWTGFLVGKPYVDKPNEQLRPPILPPDPVPVMYPRLPQGELFLCSVNQLGPCSQIFWPPNSLFGEEPNSLSPVVISDGNNNALYNPSSLPENTPMEGVLAIDENNRLIALQNFYWGS